MRDKIGTDQCKEWLKVCSFDQNLGYFSHLFINLVKVNVRFGLSQF